MNELAAFEFSEGFLHLFDTEPGMLEALQLAVNLDEGHRLPADGQQVVRAHGYRARGEKSAHGKIVSRGSDEPRKTDFCVCGFEPGYGPVGFRNRLVRTRILGGVRAGGERPPATRLYCPIQNKTIFALSTLSVSQVAKQCLFFLVS